MSSAKFWLLWTSVGAAVLMSIIGALEARAGDAVPQINDGLSGVVASARGPEAGVWVIAETRDLTTPYAKIVVTDDQGRYLLPQMPRANYKVWVRGYGLVDSKPVQSEIGKRLDLTAVVAPDAKAAAQYYPADSWYALAQPPSDSQFPGTGENGNGIATTMKSRGQWIANMQECLQCHQLGDQTTRELANNTVQGWDDRVKQARQPGDPSMGLDGAGYTGGMARVLSAFGRTAALKMFADWTQRIERGEYPTQAPPRPSGVERNVVLTLWEWQKDGSYYHDSVASDRRNPTVNANGSVYGILTNLGKLGILDPVKNAFREVDLPGADQGFVHTLTMDSKGRVWMSDLGPVFHPGTPWEKRPEFCTNGELSEFAKYYPAKGRGGANFTFVFDPATNKVDKIPSCLSGAHLWFGKGKDDVLYYTGDVVGWLDTKVWDETHDAAKSQGWCPLVLNTSGKPMIDPDRGHWNNPGDTIDPHKDTLLWADGYGLGVNPVDDSVWFGIKAPWPGSIIRLERGSHPPQTCKTERYLPPKMANGDYSAFVPHDLGFDSTGMAYVTLTSGQIGKFDRTKCKVRSGPQSASGEQCSSAWTMFDAPGPRFQGRSAAFANAGYPYLSFVDRFDSFGLGKDVAMVPMSNSDSLLALIPATGQWVNLRVPYPMGFYSRWLDGRIDDPKAGWKGRGLWATYSTVPVWHQEGGTEAEPKLVHFQLRPDPLAH
jgi:hypothetical protein